MSRELLAVLVTSWLSAREGGGIPPVVRALAEELARLGMSSAVAGLRGGERQLETCNTPVSVFAGTAVGPRSFGFSPELRHHVAKAAQSRTLFHVHGLWMYPGLMARHLALNRGAPLIISPHGMLEPWALQHSRWKKRLAAALFETRNLRTANCLHALCQKEATNFRAFGLNNPIAIIPNGIALSQFDSPPARSALEARYPVLQHRKRLLFLSRIHPKKGLPHLLRAWAASHHSPSSPPAAQPNDWVLVVAGPSEGGHEQEIKELATRLDICWSDARDSQPNSSPAHAGPAPSLLFVGPLYGEDKQVALAGADAFVLPSFSEGFSMAILEAAACRLPVLLTPECNFPELTAAGAAIEISADATGCEAGLRRLFSLPEAARQEMGLRGRKLVERSYTWPVIAQQMAEVYRWVLGDGKQPACVVT